MHSLLSADETSALPCPDRLAFKLQVSNLVSVMDRMTKLFTATLTITCLFIASCFIRATPQTAIVQQEHDTLLIEGGSNIDSLLKTNINNLISCKRITPSVKYTYTDSVIYFSLQKSDVLPHDIVFSFDNEYRNAVEISGRKTLKINVFSDVDSGSIRDVIYYNETAEYYAFDSLPMLLVISHPMCWSGLMNSFAFYQLIDYDKMCVYEFINFGNTPHLFFRMADNTLCFIEINANLVNPTKRIWDLHLTGRVLGRNGEQALLNVHGHNYRVIYIKTFNN